MCIECTAAVGSELPGVCVCVCVCRARERLQRAREEAKRPGAEKAARTQDLHKTLRVRHISHSL